jgi:hypothetical protein
MSNDTQKPVMTLNDGNIKAALWEQQGAKGAFYTASFSKSYLDENGNFQNSYNFAGTDLLKLSELSKQAYQHSRELQIKARRKEPTQSEPQHDKEQER